MKKPHPATLLLATCALFLAHAETPTLTVWDGGDAAKGGGWAAPKKDENTLKAQTAVSHSNDNALELHLEGDAWMGGGWNWHAWWPEDAGTDTTPYTHLVLWLRQKGDAIENLTVTLSSSSTKNGAEPVAVAKYLKDADVNDGEWHEVLIPLADFKGADDKPYDPKAAWEITLGSWSQNTRAFSLFVDDIAFTTREAKLEW